MQLPCGGTSYVVSGFGPQLIPLCTDITSIIGTYMGTNIDALIRNYLKVNVTNSLIGQVLSGFDSITGNPVFTAMNSSQWID